VGAQWVDAQLDEGGAIIVATLIYTAEVVIPMPSTRHTMATSSNVTNILPPLSLTTWLANSRFSPCW
jgi:hypothetical protein